MSIFFRPSVRPVCKKSLVKFFPKCDEFDLDIADLDIADLDMGWSFRDVLDIVVVGHTGFGHKKLDIFVMTPKGFRAVK